MGIDVNALKFFGLSRKLEVNFEKTVMIGRQRLYVAPLQMRRVLNNLGLPTGPEREQYKDAEQYSEWFFRLLGAKEVDSIDVSDYEGATVIHDFNLPIAGDLHGKYTAVIEAGTLEHIFNFPVAIRNCMELVRVGGHLMFCTVANNFCGHGFYQFSPELFYRVFSADNGFNIERMVLCDAFYESEQYLVADPSVVHQRVEIVGPYPIMMMVLAQKTTSVPLFSKLPQQSDYVVAWTKSSVHRDHVPPSTAGKRSVRSLVRGVFPRWLRERIRRYRSHRQYNPTLFQRDALMDGL